MLHPALAADSEWLVCADSRCATVLAADAEVCDECGGTRLERLQDMPSLLCAWAEARPVAFQLRAGRENVIGRSTADGLVEVDLTRLPGSAAVHRRHALVQGEAAEWRVTHVGTNPLLVNGQPMATGRSRVLRSGDTLEVAGVRLDFVVRPTR